MVVLAFPSPAPVVLCDCGCGQVRRKRSTSEIWADLRQLEMFDDSEYKYDLIKELQES